jgi:hypothetical protein
MIGIGTHQEQQKKQDVATMPTSHHDYLPNGVRDDPGWNLSNGVMDDPGLLARTYRDGRRRGDLLSHTPTLLKLRWQQLMCSLASSLTHSRDWDHLLPASCSYI